MRISSKQALHLAGSLLAIGGIVFVGLRLYTYGGQIDFSNFKTRNWFQLGGLALIYGLANILLAMGWYFLLEHFGATPRRKKAIQIYGVTQLAKYVPGNIMHFASRQAMSVAAGMGGWAVAKASIWEIGLLVFSGSCFAILILPQYVAPISNRWALYIFLFFIAFVTVCFYRFAGARPTKSFILYFLFLTVSGCVFIGALYIISTTEQLEFTFSVPQLISITSAFIIAWLGGFVTPGAPAGVGVRELIILFLLGSSISEAGLVVTIVLSRLISVAGDFCFFLFTGGSLTRKE